MCLAYMTSLVVALLLLLTMPDCVWLIATTLAYSTISLCQVFVCCPRPVAYVLNVILTVIIVFNLVVVYRHANAADSYVVLLMCLLNPVFAITAFVL